MRGQILFWIAIVILSAFTHAAEDEFPYVARVNGSRVSLRCGPGREYYVCTHLARGTSLEVYSRHGDEWLAVKPTDSCFSLVPANLVRQTEEDGIGEILNSETVAWIGTESKINRNCQWQVRLDQGEQVEILGEESYAPIAGAAPKRFYRIAPPSGEFRWVRVTDVEPDPHWNIVESEDPAEETEIDVAEFQVRPNRSIDASLTPAAHFIAPKKGHRTSESKAYSGKSKWRASSTNRKSFDDASLDELSLELSLMVAGDPKDWSLEPLSQAADRLTTNAASSLERARSKRLVERIREFEVIYKRHEQITKLSRDATTRPGSETVGREKQNASTAAVAERESAANGKEPSRSKEVSKPNKAPVADPQFDGTGYLAAVHSSKQTAPPYALVDKDGNVLQFVSASPGLNLHRYLRKQVGIFGDSRYESSLRSSLLTAERVIELDRHRR